jgi:hypothetical protein
VKLQEEKGCMGACGGGEQADAFGACRMAIRYRPYHDLLFFSVLPFDFQVFSVYLSPCSRDTNYWDVLVNMAVFPMLVT